MEGGATEVDGSEHKCRYEAENCGKISKVQSSGSHTGDEHLPSPVAMDAKTLPKR